MEEFLKSRNVNQSVIQRLMDDKIDCETVVVMTDDNLKRYFSAYGDRVALMAFARMELRKMDSKTEACRVRSTLSGNKRARKVARKLELGWLNFSPVLNRYKQVRSPNGGGTRQFFVEPTLMMRDFLQMAFEAFFPYGSCKYGPREHFVGDLRDLKGDIIPYDSTVEHVQNQLKLKTLRINLYTLPQPEQVDLDQIASVDRPDPNLLDQLLSVYTPEPNQPASVDTPEPNQPASVDTPEPNQPVSVDTPEPNQPASVDTPEPNQPASADKPVTNSLELAVPELCNQEPELPEEIPNEQYTSTKCTSIPQATDSRPTYSEVTFHPRHIDRLRLHHTNRVYNSSSTTQADPSAVSSSPSSFISVLDSEDEEIQLALEASLTDVFPEESTNLTDDLELTEILSQFQKKVVSTDVQTKIIIFRNNILESALRALSRKINLKATLYVKFSGEIGEDHGGPRREFFRLAISALHQSRFFEGPENQKIFQHDIAAIENKNFITIGRLVALSMAQEGPGLHFLDETLYDIMTGHDMTLTDVEVPSMPIEMTEIIQELKSVDSHQKRDQFLARHGDMLLDQGFGNAYRLKIETKGKMIHMLKKQHIYYRTSSEINQFKDGMNDVGGMWDVVTKHANLFKPLFCYVTKPITKLEMDTLLKYDFSDIGSNAKMLEDETVYAWELFMQDIEDGTVPTITMPELLSFMSGASRIPPCGFHKQIDIRFYTQEEGVTRLPYVSTCSLDMWLPRGQTPETLSAVLLRSLTESQGFLKV